MNQQQFDVIVAIIKNGAPALATELVQSLVELVKENQELKAHLKNSENKEED